MADGKLETSLFLWAVVEFSLQQLRCEMVLYIISSEETIRIIRILTSIIKNHISLSVK